VAPAAGIGYLLVNDILTDVAFALVQPSVNTVVPGGGFAAGAQTVNVFDRSMYVGAQILVGVLGTDLEVVTITAVNVGVSFTATFANAHAAGEPILGATFPVRQISDQLFTQAEMLTYISNAVNDLLADCPLIQQIVDLDIAPTEQITALPADSQKPLRVAAYGLPLRESSQSNLDSMDYTWNQQAQATPYVYFRDKVGLQNIGTWPVMGNTTPIEVIYEQRSATLLGLADGFIVPDPFLLYAKYKTLAYAYSKDGEQRNPGLAKYYTDRYAFGVKICSVFLEVVMDPNLES
jgi:hypothetical protein